MISGLTTKKIDSIEFGLLSPEDIRKMSIAQIVVADTYDEDTACIVGVQRIRELGTQMTLRT